MSETPAAPVKPDYSTFSPEQKKAIMKNMLLGAVEKLPPLPDTIEQFEIEIPLPDGFSSRTIIVRPKAEVEAARPLIVNFFGGAFIVGEPEMNVNSARAYAEKYGAVVALPTYRLAPEAKWPTPVNDGWEIVVWLSRHAEQKLGANLGNGFVVGGVSAGALLAGVCGGLSMHAQSKEAEAAPKLGTPITGLFLSIGLYVVDEICPVDLKASFKSREENRESTNLSTKGVDDAVKALGAEGKDLESLWFSPVNGIVKEKLTSKPKVYLEYDQFDPLRDDGVVYDKLLREKGIQTKTTLYREDGHAAWTVMPSDYKSTNPTHEEGAMEGMKWLLS